MLRLAVFTGHDGDVLTFGRVLRAMPGIAHVQVLSAMDIADPTIKERFEDYAASADVLLFHLMGGKESYPGFEELVARTRAKIAILAGEDFPTVKDSITVSPSEQETISRYVTYGGDGNVTNLLLYLAAEFADGSRPCEEPRLLPWEGIYHPDLAGTPALDEYLAERCQAGRPTLGLWFHRSYWTNRNTAHVDALIRAIERQGANVIPVFLQSWRDPDVGNLGYPGVVEAFFKKDGVPRIDALLNLNMFSMLVPGGDGESFLARLGVPVIQVIHTFQRLESWESSPQGLSTMDIPVSVAMPESDGAIITVPASARNDAVQDPLIGGTAARVEPIPERVDKVVRLALNWARLRRKPNAEKRVAIILHNYPPRNDRIGTAFGLDSPVSVWKLLGELQALGYHLDALPESGQTLIEDMISGLTNDRRWASSSELADRAVAAVPSDTYRAWFGELSTAVQEKMRKSWGEPPGELFVHEGRLLIPGQINGNVFIGVQPPRGFLENPAAILHSPDHPFPYHYHAYYRWIRDIFQADVVMHIGKHGSLEWLPGKGVGLSADCFPDIAISDLPNIYPYIINDPGEGTQAKRRSYCCIIDHLVPVMHNADAYGELAAVEVLIKDHDRIALEDPSKTGEARRLIWERVCQAKLDHDLAVDEDAAFADFAGFLERLRAYIHEMADTQIRDGLHVMGEPPTDARLDQFLVALTRLRNGDIPSLREALAEMKGYRYDELAANRGKLIGGKSNGQIIEELHALSIRLVEELRGRGFSPAEVAPVVREVLGESNPTVARVLSHVAERLVPKIAATTDEIDNTVAAAGGCYVSPGPSGAPTRGMADILPTGRNFFSLDPRAVPSHLAWRTGVALGDATLRRYLKEEGRYPEHIGMIVWASPAMRTGGEDVAEALYLMGVRPVWEQSSGRVKGLEVIPLAELGRPRIDVTFRISGLLRDSFPNVVELLDDAVQLVSRLDETAEENCLAAHVEAEVAEKVAAGLDGPRAWEEATFRVFGDKPGAYGAGVAEMVESQSWRNVQDLGRVYVTWGGYAYGRKHFGVPAPEQFERRLGQIDLTVHNGDTREIDLLDCCDFYNYHGGMIAAVTALRGELPRSYSGDSSDPDRVVARTTAEETKHIFRARILNPKWIESMKRHGYKGAGDMSHMVDIVFGWDATAEVVDDWMYEELAKTYPLDREMQRWLQEVNPHALQNMTERLLEAIQRGMWQAREEIEQELRRVYLQVEGTLEESTERSRS